MGDPRQNGHVALSPEDTRVRNIEDILLAADFREALKQANLYIEQYRGEEFKSKRCAVRNLGTIEVFDRTFVCTLDISGSLAGDKYAQWLDRCAAVALQSWYEISQKASEDRIRHLHPFLDVYCERPISPSLLLLFLQFLHAKRLYAPTLRLLTQFMYYIHKERKDSLNACKQEAARLLLCQLLPYVYKPDDIKRLLLYLSADKDIDLSTSLGSKGPYRESIIVILECLDDFGAEFNLETLDMERELTEMMATAKEYTIYEVPKVALDLAHSTARLQSRVLDILHGLRSEQRLWPVMEGFLQQKIIAPLVESERRWENRSQLAVSILVFWLGWKHRKRILSGARSLVFRALFRHIYEVVEAIVSLN